MEDNNPLEAPVAAAEAVAAAAAGAAADAGDATAGGEGAGRQASTLENLLVAKAWIAASEDPTVGTDQVGQHFKVKFHEIFFSLRHAHVSQRKPGWEKINMSRAVNFPTTQWTRIRKATYCCLSIRKRYPKASGENRIAWYNRIRPKLVEELKKKSLPSTAPQRFEVVADYLADFPKFCSHMDSKETTKRPAGKRKAQQDAQLSSIRQRVETQVGVVDGNRSVLDGGMGTQQGIAAMGSLLNNAYVQNQQMMAIAIHNQQQTAHNQLRALVLALNPNQVAAFDAAQPPPMPPAVFQALPPAPPPPPVFNGAPDDNNDSGNNVAADPKKQQEQRTDSDDVHEDEE